MGTGREVRTHEPAEDRFQSAAPDRTVNHAHKAHVSDAADTPDAADEADFADAADTPDAAYAVTSFDTSTRRTV